MTDLIFIAIVATPATVMLLGQIAIRSYYAWSTKRDWAASLKRHGIVPSK